MNTDALIHDAGGGCYNDDLDAAFVAAFPDQAERDQLVIATVQKLPADDVGLAERSAWAMGFVALMVHQEHPDWHFSSCLLSAHAVLMRALSLRAKILLEQEGGGLSHGTKNPTRH